MRAMLFEWRHFGTWVHFVFIRRNDRIFLGFEYLDIVLKYVHSPSCQGHAFYRISLLICNFWPFLDCEHKGNKMVLI